MIASYQHYNNSIGVSHEGTKPTNLRDGKGKEFLVLSVALW